MLVLSRTEVESLIEIDALIEAVAGAMRALSNGETSSPPRVIARAPAGLLGAMPVYLPSARILEAKLVAVFPGNAARGLPTHQALIAVFDADTGAPVALLDGEAITALRTAAGSALATRVLAREDAAVLAILGTGVQARAHARTLPRVRAFREVRIAGRDPDKARALARELAPGIPARAVGGYAEALAGADVVCATTHAHEPVVRRAWLAPGAHVNSVGFTEGREVDGDVVADAVVVVEARAATLRPYPEGANEIAWAVRDGQLDPERVVEIGEVLTGRRPGRTSPEQITLYKSVGVAAQDAAAASLVLEAARARGVGTEVAI